MTPSWTQRLPGWVRSVHLYTSLSASAAIAFFALTGLVGELRSHQEPASPPPLRVDASLAATASPALAQALRERLGLSQTPTLRDAQGLIIATADEHAIHLDATVAKRTGIIAVTRWHDLDDHAPRDPAALRAWFQARYGGDIDRADDAAGDAPSAAGDDDDAAPAGPGARDGFSLVSVWSTRSITVEAQSRRWSEHYERRVISQALADLHTGKHADWLQRRLMDAAALSLLASTLTGTVMALLWIAKRRRLVTVIPLIGGGVWLCLLVCGR